MTAPGQTIGNFQLQTLLGRGGMGSVFEAIDLKLQRPVAIKIMHPEVARNEELKQRFVQEARSAAALTHPNIVRIFEFQAEGGQMYLVMEHVQGGSLRDYLNTLYQQRVTMHTDEVLYIIGQICLGLHFAHGQGMIHRDIKPDNVLLKPNTAAGSTMPYSVLLTDFGLAKLVDAQNLVKTAINQPLGTLPYMAPEQFRGHADHRSDIYALGIMFYELIAGQLPFMPTGPAEAAQMHQQQQAQPPSRFRQDIGAQLESVILTCLAKAPEDRYQSVEELALAIQPLSSSSAQHSAAPSSSPAPPPPQSSAYDQPSIPIKQADLQQSFSKENFEEDTIIATAPNREPNRIPIRQDSLIAGRDPAIDIPLPGDKVSRNHARIDRKGDGTYTVTDLGSTNGTYFEGAKLLPDVPERWPPGQELMIGEYTLLLYKASRKPNLMNKTQVAGSGAPAPSSSGKGEMKTGIYVQGGTGIYDYSEVAKQSGPSASSGASKHNETTTTQSAKPNVSSITADLEPPRVYVEPGMVANAEVHILNTGNIVKHCRLQITGIDDQWVQVTGGTLQLLPDDSGKLPIIFRPPKEASSTAGEHLFDIRVLDEKRQQIGYGQGSLVIKPFYEFSVDMEPEIIRKRGLVWMTIANEGNARDSYVIRGKDKENGLRFFHDPRPVIIDPMTKVSVEVEIRPRSRLLIGAPKQYQFQLETTTASNMEKVKDGQLISPPILPIWMLPLLMLLCLGLVLLLLFLLFRDPSGDQEQESNAAPSPTATVDVAPFTEYLTATFQSFEGTVVPGITATAIQIQQSDEDNDGLTYAEEIELGTDPDNADSDGDDLNDGDEVNEYNTDPTEDDTDGDGLKDGDEINEFDTDPTLEDSDNDNLTDSEELQIYDTEPDREDSDGDGIRDDIEIEFGSDPNDPLSQPERTEESQQ